MTRSTPTRPATAGTAAHHSLHSVPTVPVDAALVQQLVQLKRQMSAQRLSPSKSEELITAHVLNAWFRERQLPYEITVATNPTGWDGVLHVHGAQPSDLPMAVEFKSATRTGHSNCGFQFNPQKFVFDDHACIACAEFTEGLPVRIFVALAPGEARTCMQQLRDMLLSDAEGRSSYKPDSRATLNLWSAAKRATATRTHATRGLQDCAQPAGAENVEDAITVLEQSTIERLLAT